jgi:apolipoprotein N-acyltransferase
MTAEARSYFTHLKTCVWPVLAAGCFFLAGGRYAVAAAAWLAPAFMLRWLAGAKARVAVPVAILAMAAAYFFGWRGIADVMMPPALYAGFCALLAVVYSLPYFAYRWLSPGPAPFAMTLLFPAAVVSLEFLMASFSPLGTWNAVAYTQRDNLPLIQLAALTGIYGISFIVTWFGAVANWAWENRRDGPRAARGVFAFALVLAATSLFGGVRLAATRAPGPSVRVAGVISRPFFLSEHPELLRKLLARDALAADEVATLREENRRIIADLFARTRREARAGAKIVVWGEAAAQLMADDESRLIDYGRGVAAAEKIYLVMAMAVLDMAEEKPVRNKLVLITPAGDVAWDYVKSVPVPGPEAAISLRGDGRFPVLKTPFGKLGGAICYDMDFPALVRQAGRGGVDLMLVPAHDWRELGDLHADLAAFRAVENGFSLLRPDNEAVSVAVDGLGRPIATMDYFANADAVIVADIPTRRAWTLYRYIGDAFAGLVLLALALLVVWALRIRIISGVRSA